VEELLRKRSGKNSYEKARWIQPVAANAVGEERRKS